MDSPLTGTQRRASEMVLAYLCLWVFSGCISTEYRDYPTDWPMVESTRSCAVLSGRYRNVVANTTSWQARGRVGDPTFYLSDMVRYGAAESAFADATVELLVDDDGSVRTVPDAFDSEADASIRRRSSSCGKDGSVTIAIERVGQSEHMAIEWQRYTLTLKLATDGSLVVQQKLVITGPTILLIPSKDTTEEWFRYQPVNPHST